MDSRIPQNDDNNAENSARKQKLLNLLCNKTQHKNIQSSNQQLYSLLRNTMNDVNTHVKEASDQTNTNIVVTDVNNNIKPVHSKKSNSTKQMETINENE